MSPKALTLSTEDRMIAEEKQAWLHVLSTYDGRLVLHRILERCGVYRDGFSPDALLHARESGKRSIGLQLIADMQGYDAKAYLTMITEEHDRQQEGAEHGN